MKILGNVPVKHPFWSPYFKYICRPSRRAKDHSPREVHLPFRQEKESLPKNFQVCKDVCTWVRMPNMKKP